MGLALYGYLAAAAIRRYAASSHAGPILQHRQESPMSKTCFVIAPLENVGTEVRGRSDDLLDLVIKPALEQIGFTVVRVDRLARAGKITREI
jgi:hypothetical protein